MIMNMLRRLMYGRYGGDQLSFFLLVVYLILSLLSGLRYLAFLQWIALAVLAWDLYRMFSRRIDKRRAENARFLEKVWWPIKRRAAGNKQQRTDKEHKYFTCPNCRTVCRVPRGKGKIVITCPKCGSELHGKS